MTSVELYFWPTSFYSQRTRLSLEEKAIKYKEVYVVLPKGEQNQSWYLKLNPNGEVPILKIGDQCFSESENIVDIVDKLPSTVPHKLSPDLDSAEGQQVAHWRKRIDEIKIPIITFGTSVFQEFAPARLPGGNMPTAQGVKDRFEGVIADSEKKKLKHPELKDLYDRKIALGRQRLADFFDKEKVASVLDEADVIMTEVENQLRTPASIGAAMSGAEYYLCGREFTAADINLCILLGRFRMLGLLPRFADPKKYPNIDRYWQQVQKRSTVQKVVLNNIAEVKKYTTRQMVRRGAHTAVAVGVVGVTVWLVYRLLKQ